MEEWIMIKVHACLPSSVQSVCALYDFMSYAVSVAVTVCFRV